jgi:hypothetical protein
MTKTGNDIDPNGGLEFWSLEFICYLGFGIWCLLSCLLHRFGIFKKGLSLFGHVRLVCIRKGDGLDITEANTLRISITVIALHRYPFLDVKERMAEGAGDDAGPASDAELLVDRHPVIIFRLPVAGLCRAYLHAVGLFTMVAGHGKIEPHVLPLDHFDPGTAWIACPCVKHRADQLTQATPGTLLLVNDQYLFFHSNIPSLNLKSEARNSKLETISNDKNPKFKTREE